MDLETLLGIEVDSVLRVMVMPRPMSPARVKHGNQNNGDSAVDRSPGLNGSNRKFIGTSSVNLRI